MTKYGTLMTKPETRKRFVTLMKKMKELNPKEKMSHNYLISELITMAYDNLGIEEPKLIINEKEVKHDGIIQEPTK